MSIPMQIQRFAAHFAQNRAKIERRVRVGDRPKPLCHDTRYLASVKVEYPLHPNFGQQLPVVRYEGTGDARRVLVQRTDTCLFVPLWMTDADACSRMTFGLHPFCSWNALLQLDELLSGPVEKH